MHPFARFALPILRASPSALAVDRTLCVDIVARFAAAIEDAVANGPGYDRVVVRLVQGNHDLSKSNAFTGRSVAKPLEVSGGCSAACNLRTTRAAPTTLRNTDPSRGICRDTTRDVSLRWVSLVDFAGFLAINNVTTTSDVLPTVEFSDNRVVGGVGQVGLRVESGNCPSLNCRCPAAASNPDPRAETHA